MPFSPKNPYSMAGTFAVVLVATMLKEAFEDWFRHKADNAVNRAPAHVLDKSTRQFIDKES